MNEIQDQYRNAPHYDIEYADVTRDIGFTVLLAQELAGGGKILEFCSGTGRITFPLAHAGIEAGFSVVGVDYTPAMLDIATEKLSEESPGIKQIVTLIQGDMRKVDVGKGEFSLVLVPFNSFLHMTTQKDQLAALQNAWDHLLPGGYFLADIFLPDVNRLARNMSSSWIQMEKVIPVEEEGIVLIRSGAFDYEPHNQLLSATWQYQIFKLGGERRLLETYWSPFEVRVIFAAEWKLLLEKAGFKIIEKWGSFDREPFGDSAGRMLFLCKKPR